MGRMQHGARIQQVGNRLVELRERAGMSRHQLAQASGVTVRTIYAVESAETAASLATLFKLADGLRSDITMLFIGIEWASE